MKSLEAVNVALENAVDKFVWDGKYLAGEELNHIVIGESGDFIFAKIEIYYSNDNRQELIGLTVYNVGAELVSFESIDLRSGETRLSEGGIAGVDVDFFQRMANRFGIDVTIAEEVPAVQIDSDSEKSESDYEHTIEPNSIYDVFDLEDISNVIEVPSQNVVGLLIDFD